MNNEENKTEIEIGEGTLTREDGEVMEIEIDSDAPTLEIEINPDDLPTLEIERDKLD